MTQTIVKRSVDRLPLEVARAATGGRGMDKSGTRLTMPGVLTATRQFDSLKIPRDAERPDAPFA
ncbi:hypothetical protein LJR175_008202 [Variovorax sp. LjRoot175]|uniref:hypothetical protein n=1 Tax=Variovorax sp. LjRoot175 TaxID=3342276 RepID=UPI003ECE02DC